MKNTILFFLIIMSLSLVQTGCPSPGQGNGGEGATGIITYDPQGDPDLDGIVYMNDPDMDGDGISNELETGTYTTSPFDKDTDGDGWLNGEEIGLVEHSYPRKFSPLIADLPKMSLNICGDLEIEVKYEVAVTEEQMEQRAESFETAVSSSRENSMVRTTAREYGWSVEAGIEFGTSGGKPHVVGHVNVGTSGTYSWEISCSIDNNNPRLRWTKLFGASGAIKVCNLDLINILEVLNDF